MELCDACRIWRHLARIIPLCTERDLQQLLGVLDNTAQLATSVADMTEMLEDLNMNDGEASGGDKTPVGASEDNGAENTAETEMHHRKKAKQTPDPTEETPDPTED